MTSKQAIDAIKALLFKQSFSVSKSTEGVELKYEKMEIGEPIFIITDEGEIPAPDGVYDMEDGMVLEIKEGLLDKLDMMETEKDGSEDGMKSETKMVEAELIDGTLVEIEGDELVVGAKLMVKSPDGLVTPPDADHETKEGMIITTKDGVITEIKEKVEAEEEVVEEEMNSTTLDEIAELLKISVERMTSEIESLKNKNTELESKFSKFSAQPAGQPLFDKKGYIEEQQKQKFSKLEQLAALRAKIKNNK